MQQDGGAAANSTSIDWLTSRTPPLTAIMSRSTRTRSEAAACDAHEGTERAGSYWSCTVLYARVRTRMALPCRCLVAPYSPGRLLAGDEYSGPRGVLLGETSKVSSIPPQSHFRVVY